MLAWILVLLILLDLVVKVAAIGLVPERRRPSVGMAWLLLIFLLPVVGLLVFALFGRGGIRRRRRVQNEAQAGMILLHNNTYPPLPATAKAPDWVRDALALNSRLGWLDPVAGNRVQLYADDRPVAAAMVEAVAGAERFVHLECAALTTDDLSEALVVALVAARQRGVAVRVATDARASARLPGYAGLVARLDDAGVQRPPAAAGLRSGEDLLVVDGRVAFGGSSPLTPTSGPVLAFRVEGPLAHSLSLVFAADWFRTGAGALPTELFTLPPSDPKGEVGQVLATGPGLPSENQLLMTTTLIYGARTRIALTGSFLAPEEALLVAITAAARRGVAVELFVGEESDDVVRHRARQSCYAGLLEAGVRIYRRSGRLTARHLTVDDAVAVVGSSRAATSAVSVLLLGAMVVGRIRAVEDSHRAASTEVTAAGWRRRPWPQRYLDNVLRLASALH